MDTQEILKTSASQEITEVLARDWEYRGKNQDNEAYFIKHLSQPNISVLDGDLPELVIEARLPVQKVIAFLQQLQLDELGDPFMYYPANGSIISSSTNYELINEIISQMSNESELTSGSITATFDKDKYLISYMKSDALDWVLIDYTPLKDVMMPVTNNKKIFYIFITVLLILGIIATYLLYRNIQIPIRGIVEGIHQVKEGNYSVRIEPVPNNEFNFMMVSFNEMAKQIETLIEVVYKEEIRYQEIHVKQLQSQINPHFLYNCLFIMKNMAKLKHYEGVEAMSLHLGKYYRYMTKVESKYTTIKEELEFIRNYLEIHVLRMQRLTYKINIPHEMLDISIPRLLIQPIVENACVHGVDGSLKKGVITITGTQIGSENQIIIEDNGKELSAEDLNKITGIISESESENTGIWNVNQRLLYQFNDKAGLNFSISKLGGLKVIMYW